MFGRPTAETITHGLGGRWTGRSGTAPCPAHEDRKPSLSIRDAATGAVLVHCHAGCPGESVIEALKARGLWGYAPPRRWLKCGPASQSDRGSDNTKDADRIEYALSIWDRAEPARGTLVEDYIKSRGLNMPRLQSLRFRPRLYHADDRRYWPCMVALITRGTDDEPIGIHRTFLARDGGSKAPVEKNKMMLGLHGGGAVRLAQFDPDLPLMISEGIETGLAAMQVEGNPTWAALSTSGMRTLDLPPEVQDIIILADGDDAGEGAAKASAFRWQREGRRCRIARPPRGMDFNDMLLAAGGAS